RRRLAMDRRVLPGEERLAGLPFAEQDVGAGVVLGAQQLVANVPGGPAHAGGHCRERVLERAVVAGVDPGEHHHSCGHRTSPSRWIISSWTVMDADSRSARSGAVSASCSGLRSKARKASALSQSLVTTKAPGSAG